MNLKKAFGLLALLGIVVPGLYTAVWTYRNVEPTYDDPDVNIAELYENPEDYEIKDPEGISEIIVKTNLEKTHSVNDVASIVFDYRGYDTLGESFILLTAIAGSFVILSRGHKKEEKGGEA